MITGFFKATQYTLRTIKKLGILPNLWESEIENTLSKFTTLIMARATSKYLTSGPLHVRTNRLRSSVRRVPTTGTHKIGNKHYTVIGTNVSYGKLWEEGFVKNGMTYRRQWLEPSFNDFNNQLIGELRNIGGRLR